MTKAVSYKGVYKNMIKLWLSGILLFLPFQRKIREIVSFGDTKLSHYAYLIVNLLDELTIAAFMLLAIVEYYKRREFPDRSYLVLLLPILFLISSLVASGIINGNYYHVTMLGTLDYVKNFFVIFIYATFFRELKELKTVFHLLLIVVIVIGYVTMIQEIWALTSRYVIGNAITNKKIYIFTELYNMVNGLKIDDFVARWRWGIYKALFIFNNSNMMGFYILLFFSLYFITSKKFNIFVLAPLLSGIFVSVSKMVYVAFALIIAYYFLKARKWFVVAMIPLLIFIVLSSFKVADMDSIKQENTMNEEASFRSYTRNKAVEIWKDHPIWGTGPGIYAGKISIKYNSPIYIEYNFRSDWYHFAETIGGIDQFWPQILAEGGVIGMLSFIGLLGTIIILLFTLRQKTENGELNDLFSGLIGCFLIVYIYLLGAGLNVTSILFTYFAFVGMTLGFYVAKHQQNASLPNGRGNEKILV